MAMGLPAMCHAFLGGADWSAYAARRHARTRAMFRAPASEPGSATAGSTMLTGNVPGTVRA